ncbi:anion transporter [Neobacillus niacini]|uniref:SLC13 family permease n=1 Tax=Neobacillus niacini TaxID=86668 RepID=UPI00278581BE|nr:SLC13 family permease [Neobacillus niacini]MDQ0999699.1 anion transporter [Neobacillus niacini]
MMTRMELRRIERHARLKNTIAPVSKPFVPVALHVLVLSMIVFINDLDYKAKVSLFAFLSAMILWIATKIPAGFVAISLIIFIIMMNGAQEDLLYQSLSEEVVWLMVGSFIIGEAVKESGLANRITLLTLNKSRKKSKLLLGVCMVLFSTAIFIPSTSGRAALSMPILNQLSKKFTDKEKGVLALIAPIIILMSTSAVLIGAGSHLIGIGLLESTVNQSISYVEWFIWALPFTLVITFISYLIIKWLLWPKDSIDELEVFEEIIQPSNFQKEMTNKEKKTLTIITLLFIGWVTESIHGYDIAFIAMLGAVIVMIPKHGIISWKQGIKSVSWNLIIFVAAATALGRMLVETGVVQWIEDVMMNFINLFVCAPEWFLVFIILLVTVTSHLYITSHTTRAIVFIPVLLLFSETIGLNPTTVVFMGLIGMNYCVTVPVSSKALLLFYEEGEISYDANNLLKISVIMMPVYILIMMLFYFFYWQWMGLYL